MAQPRSQGFRMRTMKRRESPGLGRSRDMVIWIYLTATRQGVARYS